MPRNRMYVRRFLNFAHHHGGAYVLASVPDTTGERGSYIAQRVELEIADCSRRIVLDFPLGRATDRRNSLRKVRILASVLANFEQAIAAEAKLAEIREREHIAPRQLARTSSEWMVHVDAWGVQVDPDANEFERLYKALEGTAPAISTSRDRLSVTLAIGAACEADARTIGREAVRAAIAVAGLSVPRRIRAGLAALS